MNLRDLAETALLVSWYGPESPRPLEHAWPEFVSEFWKSVGFLSHLWKKETATGRQRSPSATAPHLHEEILVAALLVRSVAGILDMRPPPRRDSRSDAPFSHTLRIECLQQALLTACKQQLTSLPELLKLQRLNRRLAGWQQRFHQRAQHDRRSPWRGHASDPSAAGLHHSAHNEGVLLPLERAALRWVIPARQIADPVRQAAYRQLMGQALSLISPRAFSSDGLPSPALHRRVALGGELDSVLQRSVGHERINGC